MGQKWDYLRDLLKLILRGVPKEIKSQFKNLFPKENRYLTLAEKADIYAYATEKVGFHSPNRSRIGDLLQKVDEMSS